MRTIAIGIAASLAFGGCAVAAERAHEELCLKVSELKAQLKKEDTLETLKPGAFHIAEGMWMATPPLTAMIPDVDGAMILTIDNKSRLIFTHGKDDCIARIPPFELPPQWVHALSTAKTLPGEKAEPKDELHL